MSFYNKCILVTPIAILACFAFVFPVFARVSNDPFMRQWSYEDTGVYRAWDFTTGSRGVVVAVIDDGFDSLHPDLAGNLWINRNEIPGNGLDDDKNGYADDVYGWNFVDNTNDPRPDPSGLSETELDEGIIHHGTVVAGIIGAVGNNELDGVGINWNVQLMNLKAVGNQGSGALEPLREAIYYAVDNGANIINISMVGGEDVGFSDALEYAYNHDVLVISAAGNARSDLNITPFYPVCSDAGKPQEETLGVTAIGEDHHLASFSNAGSMCVDITAPGVDIASTVRFSPTNNLNERYKDGWDGTSFATPFVSGASALIKSIQPSWTPTQIYTALLSTTHHTPGQDETVYANLFGAGLLQIDKAVEYAFTRGGSVQPETNSSSTTSSPIFLVVDTEKGTVESRDGSNVLVESPQKISALKGADDVVAFREGSEWHYTVTKKNDTNSRNISIYNGQWNGLSSWNVSSVVPLDITVGDITGDSKMEIVAAPKGDSSVLFTVFNLSGSVLSTRSSIGLHNGASVDVSLNSKTQKKDIIVVYREGQTTFLERISGSMASLMKKVISEFKSSVSVSVGDIDGNKEDEYIIMAGTGDLPRTDWYKSDGTLLRRVLVYDSPDRGGIRGYIFDAQKDGTQKLLIIPRFMGTTARVFASTGSLLYDWTYNSLNNLLFVPLK